MTPPDRLEPSVTSALARLRAARTAAAGRARTTEPIAAARVEPGKLEPGKSESGKSESKSEPPFDPTSWGGALVIMLALGAVLWVIQFINAANNYSLDRYGLRPRTISGLEGILTSPFLHASYGHLLANTAPFVLIGWVLLLSGVRPFLLASGLILVVGGLLTWAIAPSGEVVGASGLVMGWLGYLLARAFFSRRIVWIIVAIAVITFFGGLLGGLLPSVNSDVSWQGHVAGFAAGILAGWVLHPRSARAQRRAQRGPRSQALS